MRRIVRGDCLRVLPKLPREFARLMVIDPPFNSGHVQKRARIKVMRDEQGARKGFGGHAYRTTRVRSAGYDDVYEDYLGFLMPRIEAALGCLTSDASIFVHLDAREVHYVKVALDGLLGRNSFKNEIIWSYDYGGRPKNAWPRKHDTILWYARDPDRYHFDYDAIDRIAYMAPGLVGPEKAARGKTPTDVWWHTIVPTNGREKTGYPTQKPLGIVRRIVRVHSAPGGLVLDFFAGSGTTGVAAAELGRGFCLIDKSTAAIRVMNKRLAQFDPASAAKTPWTDPLSSS